MNNFPKIIFYKSWIVFLSLTSFILLVPIVEDINALRIITSAVLTMICLSEINSDVKIRYLFYVQLLVGGLSVVCIWFLFVFPNTRSLLLLEYLFLSVFFIVAAFATIYKVSKCVQLNIDTIINTIDGYLYLGLFGTAMASFLDLMCGPAFKFSIIDAQAHYLENFLYYSFVTLTTIGYGDITPIANTSKSLTIFLGVSGQLYLTIIMGIIIGKFVSKSFLD